MKKIFIVMMAMLFTLGIAAQDQMNYSGSSKFTDNISVTVQGGIVTPLSDVMKHVSPTVLIGADKYVTPWLGFGVEGRTAIAAPSGMYNPHTMFDAVNVSGYVKFNLRNLSNYQGGRKMFEPVLYTGLGWGHATCSHILGDRNYMTYRAGAELNMNLGKDRAYAIVLNPSVVWGGIDNGKLVKSHSHIELSAGLVYHFKTSNGTHAFKAPKLYDYAAMKALADEVAQLKGRKPQTKIVERVVKVDGTPYTTMVQFAQGSAQLSNDAKALLDKIPAGTEVNVTGTASPEGTTKINSELSVARASVVKEYLEARGVKVISAQGNEAGRTAIVTLK